MDIFDGPDDIDAVRVLKSLAAYAANTSSDNDFWAACIVANSICTYNLQAVDFKYHGSLGRFAALGAGAFLAPDRLLQVGGLRSEIGSLLGFNL